MIAEIGIATQLSRTTVAAVSAANRDRADSAAIAMAACYRGDRCPRVLRTTTYD